MERFIKNQHPGGGRPRKPGFQGLLLYNNIAGSASWEGEEGGESGDLENPSPDRKGGDKDTGKLHMGWQDDDDWPALDGATRNRTKTRVSSKTRVPVAPEPTKWDSRGCTPFGTGFAGLSGCSRLYYLRLFYFITRGHTL